MRGDDPKDKGDGSSGSSRWFLGAENRDVGSIHSDFIKTSAVNLCNTNAIAVYPVIGWWRERSYLGNFNSVPLRRDAKDNQVLSDDNSLHYPTKNFNPKMR